MQDGTAQSTNSDIVVIGSGIAGLSAAVAAAEELAGRDGVTVVLVDRADRLDAGGLTKWTSAYLRIDDVYEPGDGFVPDVVGFSDGRTPSWYVESLVEHLPETMEWIQDKGIRFRKLPTYFINSNRPRLQPVGGGEALLEALRPVAEQLGVQIRYRTTAQRLVLDGAGRVTGLEVTDDAGTTVLPAGAVVIASGGFEGSVEHLDAELGGDAAALRHIAPGVRFNQGEGIRMALAAGAARAGQWDSFHAEPVDPRCEDPEPLVMVFPYGILVNTEGRRFLDEGRGTVDEIYEATAREIWRQPGSTSWFITDQHFTEVEARERGILTTRKPVTADTVEELAAALGLPADTLAQTIAGFNAAVVGGEFDWRSPDGLHTEGIEPAKSNWAVALTRAPFIAYPVACAIVFTFGGLDVDDRARVVRESGEPIPGLYAAGECTGLYHGKYPGGTSVLRGMVFGRIAGQDAARSITADLVATPTA
jgi:tricarballylate dehydrogenase